MAERLVETLSAYTREGTVFPVDARLRPHGVNGELVRPLAQLRAYFAREAQLWEAMTYAKAHYVAGSCTLASEASLPRRNPLAVRFAGDPNLVSELRDMRLKLEKTNDELDNLKIGPGGLYDIDYIIGLAINSQRTGKHCPAICGSDCGPCVITAALRKTTGNAWTATPNCSARPNT